MQLCATKKETLLSGTVTHAAYYRGLAYAFTGNWTGMVDVVVRCIKSPSNLLDLFTVKSRFKVWTRFVGWWD